MQIINLKILCGNEARAREKQKPLHGQIKEVIINNWYRPE